MGRIRSALPVLRTQAERVLAEHNPCAIIDGQCARGREGGKSFCCSTCRWLGPTGCEAPLKPLGCVLGMCHSARRASPQAYKEMDQVYREAVRLDISLPIARNKHSSHQDDLRILWDAPESHWG